MKRKEKKRKEKKRKEKKKGRGGEGRGGEGRGGEERRGEERRGEERRGEERRGEDFKISKCSNSAMQWSGRNETTKLDIKILTPFVMLHPDLLVRLWRLNRMIQPMNNVESLTAQEQR
jgi:hypothetical protein